MGGNVFTVPGPDGRPALKVPRMSHEQYGHMRDYCITKLQTTFDYVAVPHEAPGKDSHGDVDVHVSKLKRPIDKRELGELLGAERMDLTGTITNSYALLLPSPLVGGDDKQYCQVDVHHAAEGYEDWELMFQSYGDLMQIVGKFLRYAGFTATDKGLHVRIPEIEEAGRRTQSMLYLCHSAEQFMSFLRLDKEKWQAGFESQEDLFTWCCTGRFFAAKSFEGDVENHNDRQRYRKRNMFSEFANNWLPKHQDLCLGSNDRAAIRQVALKEAIAYFDKETEFERKLQDWQQEEAEKAFWERVNTTVPRTGDNMRLARRALKRWVIFSGLDPILSEEVELDAEKQPLWTAKIAAAADGGASIYEWIEKHWEVAYRLEKQREAAEQERREANKRKDV